MLPYLQVGPLAVPVPGFILLAGFWLGATLMERIAPRHTENSGQLRNLLFYGALAGILGARLGYFFQYPDAFVQAPASLISLDVYLLDPWSGLLVAGMFALIYGQRKGLDLWGSLDGLTPFLATLALAFPLANLASGLGFGLPTRLPWAINLWGAARHPAQLYEALAAGLILAFVLRASRSRLPGLLFVRFLLLSASAQLLLGAFRADSAVLANGWRLAQIGAWLVLAVSTVLLQRLNSPHPKE